MGDGAEGASGDALILGKRAGNVGLKNKLFSLRHLGQGGLGDAEIFGDDVRGRVRHPVGEEDGLVFGKVAVVEDEHELGAVGRKSLNGVRNAGREVPEIAFFDVGYKTFSIAVDARNARAAVEHVGPLRGGVPVELADAAGGEAHVHAREGL